MENQSVNVTADPISAASKAVESVANALNTAFAIGGQLLIGQQAGRLADKQFLRDTFRLPQDVFEKYRNTQPLEIAIYITFGLISVAILAMAFTSNKKA